LVFNKGAKAIQWRKSSLFNKCSGRTGYPHANSYLTPYTNINSKWFKDLNLRAKVGNVLLEVLARMQNKLEPSHMLVGM